MHPKEDMLRAFIDSELPSTQLQQVREHLARCPDCQSRLVEIRGLAEQVQGRLNFLSPGPLEGPRSAQTAYARFSSHPKSIKSRKESRTTMDYRKPTRRPLWTALAVLAVLALALSLTPVQAWASSFLSLFRIQRITVVQFDPAAVEDSQNAINANRDAIEKIFADDLKVEENGKKQTVSTSAEAASAAGFTPRLPSGLDKQLELTVQPGFHAEFTIDQPKLQELMDVVGVDVKLPPSVDGKVATADVSDAVVAAYGCPAGASEKQSLKDCTVLMQVPSPVLNTPAGLDVPRLGQAMFQVLGMPEAEAKALSQRIDWATTLVVPIPQGKGFEYQEVQVDGVPATFVRSDNENSYMLMWVKDGVIYNLHGMGDLTEAQQIANSLQ